MALCVCVCVSVRAHGSVHTHSRGALQGERMGVLHFLLLFGWTDSTAPLLSQHNGSFELHLFLFLNKPFKFCYR